MAADGITISERERSIAKKVLAPFADRIDRVAIFGSRVLGRARPESDIDLVLYGGLDDRVVARIWTLFHQSSLSVTVDVVRYEGLGETSLRRHIDRYAKILFTHDDLMATQAAPAA